MISFAIDENWHFLYCCAILKQGKYLMNCPWIVSVQKNVLCVQLGMSRSCMEGEWF